MCYGALKALQHDEPLDDGSGKKKSAGGSALRKDPNFIAVLGELERQRLDKGFELHPKMTALKNLVIQHFGARLVDAGGEGEEDDGRRGMAEGRVMVFASFREVVDELVEVLNREKPLIRAMKLVGQATDKQGNAGLNQKQQQAVSVAQASIKMAG
jgi:ATP-dependent DNA helicase MPH1